MTGLLILRRYCGDEIFQLREANVRRISHLGQFGFSFEVDVEPTPVKALPDTVGLGAQPNAETSVAVEAPEPILTVGTRLNTPFPNYPSRLYYVEHDVLRNVEIEILEVNDLRVNARMCGVATDVNIYDGSVPDTKVEITAWFKRKGVW